MDPHHEAPYVAVIFSSQRDVERSPGNDAEYNATALAMRELAAQQPGYVGFENAYGADGFGIAVSYWRSEDDARAWKAVAEHRAAQRNGREHWYTSYELRVATVTRSYSFARDGSSDA